MTTKDEALKQALEALEEIHPGNMTPMAEKTWDTAITALRRALAQKDEQEPIGEAHAYDSATRYTHCIWDANVVPVGTKLYTAPPKRQPLTDAGINEIAESMPGGLAGFMKGWGWQQFARAIEAAHGIGAEHDAR